MSYGYEQRPEVEPLSPTTAAPPGYATPPDEIPRITAANLNQDIISARHIVAGTITAEEIAANTITAANILAGTITAAQIAANTITANELNVNELSAIVADVGTLTAGYLEGDNVEIDLTDTNPTAIRVKDGGGFVTFSVNKSGTISCETILVNDGMVLTGDFTHLSGVHTRGIDVTLSTGSTAFDFESLVVISKSGSNGVITMNAGGLIDTHDLNVDGALDINSADTTPFEVRNGASSYLRVVSGNVIVEGDLTVNGSAPQATSYEGSNFSFLGLTQDFQIEDAGSVGATGSHWIQVDVDGTTGYIRVFSSK